MRKLILIALPLLFFFISCDHQNGITLKGKLGDKFKSEIHLAQEGDKFRGYFIYTDKASDKIEIRGTKAGSILRLEEFNNRENKLTGIFEGAFDGNTYTGRWSDPSGKQQVPFTYSIQTEVKKESQKITKIPKGIQKSYKEWVDKQVDSGEFWHMTTRDAYHEKYWDGPLPDGMEYGDNCLDGLPDMFSDLHFGDINQDGKVDCYGRIFPFYCQPGTWQVNADMHLFFFSQPDGTYQAFVQPWDEISSKIGPAGSLDTILPDGTLSYTGVDYGPDDANCCPSKEWQIEFKYVNGRFVRQ